MLESSDISQSPEDTREELERLFLFSVSWALGGLLEPDERMKFDHYLRQLCPKNMPSLDGAVGAASASDVDSASGTYFVRLVIKRIVFLLGCNLPPVIFRPLHGKIYLARRLLQPAYDLE